MSPPPAPDALALALPVRRLAPAAEVLGVPISGLTCAGFVELAVRRIAARLRTLFTTANAHSIVVAQRLPAFHEHFRAADAVLPDGMLAVLGARWRRGEVPERVAGPDFLEAFLSRAADARLRVFFLGATDATLARIAERCRARFPGLDVAGTLAPPFGDWSDEVDASLVAAVNAARPDALFVGMTAPRQELWLSRNLHRLDVPFAMGVGAAFDFLAGTKPRAPRAVGRLGLEWLWRLAAEPRRMWRRNLSSAVFLWKLLTQA
jgi:N-acetylglucosaminyldiphosphoundecaprenol N-acetyl-beta-D-mannosaminyltransferase